MTSSLNPKRRSVLFKQNNKRAVVTDHRSKKSFITRSINHTSRNGTAAAELHRHYARQRTR